MTTPRLHERIAPEAAQSNLARIVVDAGSPPLDCMVVDYSAGGACLELTSHESLPQHFELVYGAIRKECALVWTRDLRVGVEF